MGIEKIDTGATDPAGETKLRGGALDGSEGGQAVDHTAYAKGRNPDTVVRVDNEKDTLYKDGLEVEDDTPTLIPKPGTDSTR
jgi:hypothetical protein